jgi:hypothetical protein
MNDKNFFQIKKSKQIYFIFFLYFAFIPNIFDLTVKFIKNKNKFTLNVDYSF